MEFLQSELAWALAEGHCLYLLRAQRIIQGSGWQHTDLEGRAGARFLVFSDLLPDSWHVEFSGLSCLKYELGV